MSRDLDSNTEDGGGKEECERENFEVRQHRRRVLNPDLYPLLFLYGE